jgi:hypothetical protein
VIETFLLYSKNRFIALFELRTAAKNINKGSKIEEEIGTYVSAGSLKIEPS